MVDSLGTVVDAASFSASDKQRLLALVQSKESTDDDEGEFGAPAASVYKSHSSSIFDVLEDLKEKAEEQLSSLRKAEDSAVHNFQMLKQSLEDQMAADTKALDAAKSAKAAAEGAKAVAEGELASTAKDLEQAQATLKTCAADCMQTAGDHEATVASRKEELTTLAKAKALLTSSTAGAVAQTYSLLQLRAWTRADLANNEVVAMIKRLAKKEHSSALAQLASRISAVIQYGGAAGEDPFAKVKELISGLISKLEADKSSDASEKAYCDEQIAKTSEKKGELEYDIQKLATKIDVASARSTSLKEEVKKTQAELAALAKSQAEMDQIRASSHADYMAAKEDLEEGLGGVRKALGLLRDYYGAGAAAGAAMLQEAGASDDGAQQPAPPETFTKATGAGSSIIGILEVVESDFAKNLASVETEESDEESDYAVVTQENSVSKTLKDQDVKYMTAEYKALDKSLTELSADKDSKGTELSAVLTYFGKIKERCIAKAETYEERAAKRASEIQGLKDALAVLENETAFMQRGRRHAAGSASRFLDAAAAA